MKYFYSPNKYYRFIFDNKYPRMYFSFRCNTFLLYPDSSTFSCPRTHSKWNKGNAQIHSRNSQQCFLINHSVHICYDFVKLEDFKPKIIHLVIGSVLQTKGTSARNKKEEKKGAKEAENSLELIPRWRT